MLHRIMFPAECYSRQRVYNSFGRNQHTMRHRRIWLAVTNCLICWNKAVLKKRNDAFKYRFSTKRVNTGSFQNEYRFLSVPEYRYATLHWTNSMILCLTLLLLVANLANIKCAKNLKNDWNPGTWVLIWEFSARAIQWVPTRQGLDGFQKSLRPCA